MSERDSLKTVLAESFDEISSKGKHPLVTVVVLTKNSEKCIEKCILSLLCQEFPRQMYEILVVDAGSRDKTLEICRRYGVRIIEDPGGTVGHSRNVGVKTARGNYVAFIDSDCIADKQWLFKLVNSILGADESVVAVGGPNLVPEDDSIIGKVISYMQETFLGSGGSPQSYRINKPKPVYSLANCNALYKREILLNHPYDNSLNIGEDCDLNFRLRQHGYKLLYIPDAIVWHYRPNSIKTFAKKMFLYGLSMARLHKKHRKIVRWYAPLVPSVLIAAVLMCLVSCFYGSIFQFLAVFFVTYVGASLYICLK
ncbi:glycosyltransferase family 2 protein, partial [Candidatus Geothermarchaeota archaeon]